jgi:hypothetical protein
MRQFGEVTRQERIGPGESTDGTRSVQGRIGQAPRLILRFFIVLSNGGWFRRLRVTLQIDGTAQDGFLIAKSPQTVFDNTLNSGERKPGL